MNAHRTHIAETSPPETDLLVVGSGLAGLTVAALAARAGRSTVVLEQSSHLGGRAATRLRDGIHFNLGPRALYCHGHAFRLLRELNVPFSGGPPQPGRGQLLRGSELQPRAFQAFELPTTLGGLIRSGLLSLGEKWRLLRFLGGLAKLDPRPFDRMSLADWTARTAQTPALSSLFHAFFRLTTYAHDPDRISAGAVLEQFQIGFLGGVWYLDHGWQTLIDGLRERAESLGATVRAGERVRAIEVHDGGVTARLGSGATLRARAAVLAVAPRTIAELLALLESAPLGRRLRNSEPIRAACLDVALSELPRGNERFALGLDEPYYFSVHSAAARLAAPGVAVLHVMKYLGTEHASPDELEHGLASFLDRVQPGWQQRAVAQRFLPNMTVSEGMPRADQGGLTGRPGVAVADRPGVFVAGDWVGGRGQLADASAASAEEAAQAALGWLANCRSPEYAAR